MLKAQRKGEEASLRAEERLRECAWLEGFYWWFVGRRHILRLLRRKVLNRPPGLPALDVGCGTGRILSDLQEEGRAVGLDLLEEALRMARERGCRMLVCGDAHRLPFRENSFGLVTALDVLEHLDDDLGALKEMHRVLAPGGYLLLTVPALKILWSEHDEALEHRRRYSPSELRRKVVGAGFEVSKLTYAITFLFPPILLFRLLQRLAGRRRRRAKTAHIIFPWPINAAFTATLFLEAWLLPHISLPIGVSLICVAKKV